MRADTTLRHIAKHRARIEDQKNSGLTVTEWCKKTGVSRPAYYKSKNALAALTAAVPDKYSVRSLQEAPDSGAPAAQPHMSIRCGNVEIAFYEPLNVEEILSLVSRIREFDD